MRVQPAVIIESATRVSEASEDRNDGGADLESSTRSMSVTSSTNTINRRRSLDNIIEVKPFHSFQTPPPKK